VLVGTLYETISRFDVELAVSTDSANADLAGRAERGYVWGATVALTNCEASGGVPND
jgi:hypothetical protein